MTTCDKNFFDNNFFKRTFRQDLLKELYWMNEFFDKNLT